MFSKSKARVFFDERRSRQYRPQREHTEIEEELHEIAHIDYDRVSIVSDPTSYQACKSTADASLDCQSFGSCTV